MITEERYHIYGGSYEWGIGPSRRVMMLDSNGLTVQQPDIFVNPLVTPYSVTSDGASDDTTRFQAAVTAAAGKTVFIPKRTTAIRLRSTITVPANTRIVSNGATVTFDFPVATSTANGILFSLQGSNIEFDGLIIDANGLSGMLTGNRYAIGYEPSDATRLSNIRIRNCRFTNLLQSAGAVPATTEVMHAIYMKQVDGLWIDDNVFDTLSGACVYLIDTKRAKIRGNDLKLHGWAGIWLHNSNVDWEIVGNDFRDSTSANPVYWGGAIDCMGEGGPDTDGVIERNRFGGYFRYGAAMRLLSSRRVEVALNSFKACDVDNDPQDESNLILVGVRDNVTNWGPWQDISIHHNTFYATGAGIQKPISVLTTSGNNANTTAADGLDVFGNFFIKQDGSNYFGQCVRVHGGNAGANNINISGNKGHCKPYTNATYTSIPGAIVVDSLSGKTMDRVQIVNNNLEYDGTGSTNNHVGVYIGADVTNEEIALNAFKNFYRSIWFVGTPTRPPFRNSYQNAAGGSAIVTGAATVVNPDNTSIVAASFALVDGVTAPSTATGLAYQYVDTADGDLKEKFGDGTTKVVSADT